MTLAPSTSLVDALRQYRLLDPVQLDEVTRTLQGRFPDPKALAGELIQRGWLTPYQANQVLQGRRRELLLGSYVLLERLGEGGMGQVFKARNWKLGRIVALKLIRKERLANPDAIRRFEREVRAVAALSHPNIVLAYDADQIDGTHFLVMEYVEGAIDLSRLVKKNGPLPVLEACEYIRQAALGLHHAHERGMVHRDIKPSNLLLTCGGTSIKVLDMGLARLDQPSMDDDRSSTMTQEGTVVGTPDYIAPEQALASHTVDIRADLYSLGCTLYFLLAGRVPFPGGSMTEKLLKHQLHQPQPIEQLRPDVPPEIAGVVRKLMAKKPEDRYQTPAEAATALAASAEERTVAEGSPPMAIPVSRQDTVGSPFAALATSDTVESKNPPQRLLRRAEQRRWMLLSAAIGSLVLIGAGVLTYLLVKDAGEKAPPKKEKGDRVADSDGPKKTPGKVDDAWLKGVAALPAAKQVEAVADKLKELNKGFDGKVTPKIEGGVVTELSFITDNVTDISPVRALTGLRKLSVHGSGPVPIRNGKLADLSPLKDMQLTYLDCGLTQVSDLSPLAGMKPETLLLFGTLVSDLSPLADMRLGFLECGHTPVKDLSPLKDMNLGGLHCQHTPIASFAPLANMKLKELWCYTTQVTDFSPLKGVPLENIKCDFKPFRDTEILRSIKTLKMINSKPAAEFWKEVDAQQAAFDAWVKQVAAMKAEQQVEAVKAELMKRNPGFDGTVKEKIEGGVVTHLEFFTDNVTDISPVRALSDLSILKCNGSGWRKGILADLFPLKGMKLTRLDCQSTLVSDLSPLRGMKMTLLRVDATKVSDLSPIKDMPLFWLNCGYTNVSDLAPLKDMKLTTLLCGSTKVSDLSPLKDMKLTDLTCQSTQVTDLAPLRGMPLKSLMCDFKNERDAEILHSIKTLETINGKPAKQFWEGVDEKKP